MKLEADKKENIHTDGTDDAWLLVTILNADGKPINSAPPVELTIVKGPGEFPTGPNISFDSKSDIRILDGQAAITFRSYYAGDTVIRVVSPGLKAADITLHFSGPVAWQEGQSPAVQPRPYVRYDRRNPPAPAQTFGRNNPTFPSSSLDGHPGAAAADGDIKTYWQPVANDANPSWTVDLERFVTLSRVRLTFSTAAAYKLLIEVSDDQRSWRPLSDLTNNDKSSATIEVTAPADTKGRFMRLRFQRDGPNTLIQLAEVEVLGT